ncbi:MAG TPA: hypothetical protein VL326_15595 [Kofleriaceae bacterium]|nr:hypothetical protein [Kofleriaceae bacterium]
MLRVVALVAAVIAVSWGDAHADDDLVDRTVVFARGTTLYKSDAKGKNETELATLPDKAVVRQLRTDAVGKILLADIGGTWSWMPLDGSTKSLTDLPCDAGPAQLAEDGLCVLCRQKKGGSIIVNLASGKVTPVDVPTTGARLAGTGAERKLVWADDNGVWTASPATPKKPTKAAPEAPLRNFSPSPDGSHAVGTYKGEVFDTPKTKKPGEILMVFALDGEGAKRKAIQNGVPVEWSHDSKWVLLQDGASACIMLAVGGQYKCWRGYTAAALAPDGKYALLLGNRDGSKKQNKDDKKKSSKKDKKADKKAKKKEPDPPPEEPAPDESGEVEGEDGDAAVPTDDVTVAPPSGPLALYIAQLDGAFTTSPKLVSKIIDGAAVFVPASP